MGSASWKTRTGRAGAGGAGGHDRGGLQLHQFGVDHHHGRGQRQHHRIQRIPIPRAPSATTPASPPPPVQVGNVSTLAIGGLFKGALVGTEAYADYVNSTGGVNGRKIVVDSADDGYTGAGNKQATQNAVTNDFALVGGFSPPGQLRRHRPGRQPGDARRLGVLDPATNKLPNVYSAVPLDGGWEEGPLQYFKSKFGLARPAARGHAGGRPAVGRGRLGRGEVRDGEGRLQGRLRPDLYGDTQTDFTQNVIAMKNAGVKMLFIDQMSEVYASALLKNLSQQNFHPIVVLGAATYTHVLIPAAGGRGGSQRRLLRPERLALPGRGPGGHSRRWPPSSLGPGGRPRIQRRPVHPVRLALGELFAQALQNAGTDPSRGSLLQALSKITSFNGDYIVTTNNPAAKTTSQLLPARPGAQRAVTSGRTILRSTAAPTATVATTPT